MVVSFRGVLVFLLDIFLCSVSSCVSFFVCGDTWSIIPGLVIVDNFTVVCDKSPKEVGLWDPFQMA